MKNKVKLENRTKKQLINELKKLRRQVDKLDKVGTKRKQAEEVLRWSERELAIRKMIAHVFFTVPDDEMYWEVLQIVLEAMESKYGTFGYIDENGALVIPSMTRDIWDQCQVPDKSIVFPRETWGDSIWCRAIREKKTLYSNKPSLVPKGHITILRNISISIIYQGKVIGLLQVANKETDYDREDIQLSKTIAKAIAPVLNTRLQRDRDERERRQVEEGLRVRDCAIASSINAITITDLELNLTYINNSFLELWGYEDDKEILGRPATEFWLARRSASEIIDILRDRGSWTGELVARRKDGSLFDVQVWANTVTSETGKTICIMASFIDITERKRAEEQLQETNRLLLEANRQLKKNQQELIQSEKMASIGQLSAGVAHEINNPLSFIMSNLRALKEYVEAFRNLFEQYNKLSAETWNCVQVRQIAAWERIEQIREQENLPYILKDINGLLSESIEGTKRIHEVVRNLKNFARPDEAQINEADINDCIETTLKIVGNEMKYRCTVNKYLNPLPSIYCYPGQLNQVFMNLLLNAAHAIREQGEITITTEVADSHIVVKISDTGVGIPPENLSRIFDPFFTTKDVGKGTGLGLSISQRIIQKHRGTIEVESQVGKGTTFTIRLPVEGVPDS